jgi:hypothetical protein
MQSLPHVAATLLAANAVAIADHVPGEDHRQVLLHEGGHKVPCTGGKEEREVLRHYSSYADRYSTEQHPACDSTGALQALQGAGDNPFPYTLGKSILATALTVRPVAIHGSK